MLPLASSSDWALERASQKEEFNAEQWLHLVESRRDAVVKRYAQLRGDQHP